MHMVMLGKILFKGSNFNEVLQMNKKCSIKYNNPVYNTMDSHAKYIMFKCFSIDPEQRPSAASILESPFFNRNHSQSQESMTYLPLDELQTKEETLLNNNYLQNNNDDEQTKLRKANKNTNTN